MIVDRDLGPVASWWFEDRRRPVYPNSRSELRRLLEMCQSATEVLEAHDLLRPVKVVLSGWLRSSSDSNALVRVEEPDVIVIMPKEVGARGLLTHCETTLDQLERKHSFLYPVDIDILGVGAVLTVKGTRCELPDVTWIWGKTLDSHIVDVRTQCDAWLPYTLFAEPQREVWQRNAPRLEAALQEIQNRLGIAPYVNEHSDYAIIDGFRLINHTDVDGEVLRTYPGL